MSEKGWVQVRVRAMTHDRLLAVARRLQTATELGLYSPRGNTRDIISLDEAITVLLDRDKRHRERRKAHAERKRRLPIRYEG